MRSWALLLVLGLGQAAYGQSTLLIEAKAPGKTADFVERMVLTPLETHTIGTQGVRRMRGMAVDGRCLLRLDLTAAADPQVVGMLVSNRAAVARAILPPGCTMEILPSADSTFMLVTVGPATYRTLDELSNIAKKTVWPRLAKVPGVTHIRLLGVTERQVQVKIDPQKLRAYNITLDQIVAALQPADTVGSGSTIQEKKVPVRKRETVADLGNTPVLPGKNVFIRDLATVDSEDAAGEHAKVAFPSTGKVNSRRVVLFLVQLAPGILNSSAKKKLEKAVDELWAKLRDDEVDCSSKLLQTDDTTVVMRLPSDLRVELRWQKAEAAVQAIMQQAQVHNKVFSIVRRDGDEVFLYVFGGGDKKAAFRKSLRGVLAKIEGANCRVGDLCSPLQPWPGEGAQFVARLRGKDLDKLHKLAEQLSKRLSTTPGVVDVDYFPRMRQEVRVERDREKAGLAGLSREDIATSLVAPTTRTHETAILGWPWRVTLKTPLAVRTNDVGEIPIAKEGTTKDLKRDVARIKTITVPGGILHDEGKSCAIVFGNLDGRTLEEVRTEIRRLSKELAGNGVEIEVE